MNRKLKISGFQFFCIIFIFGVGTTPSIEIYTRAKQDAWISLLIGLILGCLLFYVYIKLYSFFPELPFTKYIQLILGKYIGKLLSIVYIVYFIYIAARILRNFEEIMVMTLYSASSKISIGLLMITLVMYVTYKGFETFARTNEVIFFVLMIVIFLFVGFEIINKIININNLRPVLENGWKPIIKAVFPTSVTSPFGEIFTLSMIMQYLNKKENAIRVGIPAFIFSGLTLIMFSIGNTAILGLSVIERTIYPLLTAVSYINIAHFITRLDTFIVVIAVCTVFVKITIYFYCAVSGAADLFRVKKTSDLIYPIAIIIVLTSLWMAPNFIEHNKEEVQLVPYLLHIPLQIIVPVILLLIVLIQRKLNVKKIGV